MAVTHHIYLTQQTLARYGYVLFSSLQEKMTIKAMPLSSC